MAKHTPVDALIAHDGRTSILLWLVINAIGRRHSAASQWRQGQPQAATGRVWLSHPTVAAHDRSILRPAVQAALTVIASIR